MDWGAALSMNTRFSLVTNVSRTDAQRIRHTAPSWLRTFGDRLAELVVVIDPNVATGRIATMQGQGGALDEIVSEVRRLESADSRVRSLILSEAAALLPIAQRWFRAGIPMRCQAGTPIMAFVAAFESATMPLVLRADCDMLFHDQGWVERAASLVESGSYMLVEPPRLGRGRPGAEPLVVSTRALFVAPARLRDALLPIEAHRLGVLRASHRRLLGRSPWLALEQMFEIERLRGNLRHIILDEPLGYSLHVAARADAARRDFGERVTRIETGDLPERQRHSWNYLDSAWASSPDLLGDARL